MWNVKKYFNRPRSRSIDSYENNEYILINAVKACDIRRIVHIYAFETVEQKMINMSNDNILHIAVGTENSIIVKVILLFYEKRWKFSKQRNKQGLRPIDMANKEIETVFRQWDGEIDTNGENFKNNSSIQSVSEMRKKLNGSILIQRLSQLTHKSKVLMSIDGGGIRGLAAIQILMTLEDELGMPLYNIVDWIAGTSTGAYISIMLAQKRSLEDMRKIYLRFKGKVFRGMRPYNTTALENCLQEILGKEPFSSVKKPKLIVTTCMVNNNIPQLKLFRNYTTFINKNEEYNDKFEKDFNNFSTWEVGRSSSAAPTYFEPYKGLIDGGIMSNNPAIELLTEFFEHNYSKLINENLSNISSDSISENDQNFLNEMNDKIIKTTKNLWPTSYCLKKNNKILEKGDDMMENIACLISIGTGGWKGNMKVPEGGSYFQQLPITNPTTNNNNNNNNNEPQKKNILKKLADLKGILPIFIRQLTASDGLPVERARAWCHSIGVPYFRFTASHTMRLKLDDSNDVAIVQMMWDTEIYLRTEGKGEIAKLINYLKLFCKMKESLEC
ncbi:85/88 kDa calcium-independent phospholipase A2 [Strongyloides ratti]|uniref:85/88 kDa calcium-independent phospholipase A2 n=1 Tax=Strongyloides ratti TaxID=34506 RepID=A0A090L3A4_STRRB|nr:85/88 kDa calcium-independent phospholipase A2 [Strongyloides ratti]CEF62602.1 85/88 kDa calcium-independent phospholipase A2 [Strongyloides ratti]